MGKYTLIVVAGFVVVFGWIKGNLNRASENFADNFLEHHGRAEARLVAYSLAQMSLAALSDSAAWREGYAEVEVSGGTGWAIVEDNTTDTTLSSGQVRITAGGSSGGMADTVIAMVSFSTSIPPGLHGGITANSTVTTLGNLVVDGRDHDLDGNLIAGQGTMSVSTTQAFDQGGSSTAGGTAGGVDYEPEKPADPLIVEENATYEFPGSPDAVFGYEEGTLKALAQSEEDGSQYVTDPSELTFPLSGITYVELGASGDDDDDDGGGGGGGDDDGEGGGDDDGEGGGDDDDDDGEGGGDDDGGGGDDDGSAIWQSMDFGISSGVLVVHNAAGNAAIKNLNSGTFKGLIIADDIEKIHMTIIGAVVSLTTSPSGNCIGNGSGQILYSTEALEQAADLTVAGGGEDMSVVSWLE
jgi:hypothetical protein